jgi:hypothetical protein
MGVGGADIGWDKVAAIGLNVQRSMWSKGKPGTGLHEYGTCFPGCKIGEAGVVGVHEELETKPIDETQGIYNPRRRGICASSEAEDAVTQFPEIQWSWLNVTPQQRQSHRRPVNP